MGRKKLLQIWPGTPTDQDWQGWPPGLGHAPLSDQDQQQQHGGLGRLHVSAFLGAVHAWGIAFTLPACLTHSPIVEAMCVAAWRECQLLFLHHPPTCSEPPSGLAHRSAVPAPSPGSTGLSVHEEQWNHAGLVKQPHAKPTHPRTSPCSPSALWTAGPIAVGLGPGWCRCS